MRSPKVNTSRLAGALCLFGVALHILLCGAVLDSLGFHYAEDEGAWYEKIHPGTLFIFLSFFALLWQRNPIRESIALYRKYRAYCWLLIIDLLLVAYMVARDGTPGLAFMLNTHLTVPICAIVLSGRPAPWRYAAVQGFVALAVANSLIAIAESLGKFRIFAFDPRWNALSETYFRATALEGYPLTNAAFTTVALFVAMGLHYSPPLNLLLIMAFVMSLVAFGGRVALAVAVSGLLLLGLHKIIGLFSSGRMTPRTAAIAIIAPVLLLGGVYLTVHSGMGERIAMHTEWDESADSRQLALAAPDYMSEEEIVFGVSNARIEDITARMGQHMKLLYIENPWLLMFMHLGAVAFPVWLLATFAFVRRLINDQPFALMLTATSYFLIASTFNSFASKEAVYLIMVSAVVCASRIRT